MASLTFSLERASVATATRAVVVQTVMGAVLFMGTACEPDLAGSPDGGASRGVDAGPIVSADAGGGVDGGLGDGGSNVSVDGGTPSPDGGGAECGRLPTATTYGYVGGPDDVIAAPVRTVVAMGGSVEVDAAVVDFVNAANGGDVLTLRASGSVDSYTPYFYDELTYSPAPNSSATLRFDLDSATDSAAVFCRVQRAEAIWLAGGDQWDYLGGWSPTLAQVVNGDTDRPIGGTSAGAMVLSQYAFGAEFGGVTSSEALNAPSDANFAPLTSTFAQPEFAHTLIDTHFSERGREGRLLVFAARVARDTGESLWAIGLDERAAIVVTARRFEVLAGESERSVWLYRIESTPEIGATLTLENVRRYRLDGGATGVWPPVDSADSVGPFLVDTIDVIESVIEVRP